MTGPTDTSAPATGSDPQRARPAAEAAAAVLPAADPLTAMAPQAGTPHVTASFAGAALAALEGGGTGTVGVLVGAELVDALASSPLGELDLAAAVQPALDAAATALGGHAGAARVVELGDVVGVLGEEFTVVPLVGAGIAAAVVVSESALAGPGAPAAPGTAAPAPEPAPSAPHLGPIPPAAPTPAAAPAYAPLPSRGIELLHGVVMDVTVELGRTRMSVRDLLALTPGTVLELDRAAGSPADLLVNGRLIARGEVVVVDEDFGLRVTEIVDSAPVGQTA